MLDGFHRHHSQLAFRDRTRLRLSEEAFRAARKVAANSLDPPDRAFLKDNGSYERHRLFYEYHMASELNERTYRDLSQVDRTLVEVVILQQFLLIEEANTFRDSFSVGRSVAVLGWMIQERFQYILLQTGDRSFTELTSLRDTLGIDPNVWETRLVGATAEAKAMMQISRARGLRVYPSTLIDDVMMGIDFLVETLDGHGACISVKTDVGGRTRFLLEPDAGYEQAWNRIERGTQDFREYTRRDWRPVLLMMGKARGEPFSLYEKPGKIPKWVAHLERILNRPPANDNLDLTA